MKLSYRDIDAQVKNGKAITTLPKGTTHYLFNIVDDKRFMLSHPRMGQMTDYKKGNYSTKAFSVK